MTRRLLLKAAGALAFLASVPFQVFAASGTAFQSDAFQGFQTVFVRANGRTPRPR